MENNNHIFIVSVITLIIVSIILVLMVINMQLFFSYSSSDASRLRVPSDTLKGAGQVTYPDSMRAGTVGTCSSADAMCCEGSVCDSKTKCEACGGTWTDD